jgi:hypothetical protein
MTQATVCSRIGVLSMAVLAWLCAYSAAVPQDVAPQPPSSWLAEQLRVQIEAIGRLPRITPRGDAVRALDSVIRFYERRAFRPVWICDEGLLPHADVFVRMIRQVEREGIRSAGYHVSRIDRLCIISGQCMVVMPNYKKPWHRTATSPQGEAGRSFQTDRNCRKGIATPELSHYGLDCSSRQTWIDFPLPWRMSSMRRLNKG